MWELVVRPNLYAMDLKEVVATYFPFPLIATNEMYSIGRELVPDVPLAHAFDGAHPPQPDLPTIPSDFGGPSDDKDDVMEEGEN